MGEKDHIEKFALWEKTNHVPLIVVAPGVTKPESRCGHPIDMTVLYPTLLELCGLPANDQVEGVSLASILRQPQNAMDRAVVVSGAEGPHFAVINQSWRYIRYGDGGEELYDLKNDPQELTNLADSPEHAPIKTRLMAAFQQWQDDTSDPFADPQKLRNFTRSQQDAIGSDYRGNRSFRWPYLEEFRK